MLNNRLFKSVIQVIPYDGAASVPGFLLHCCVRFFPVYNKDFDTISTQEKISQFFIRMRVKLAKTRHDLYFFHNINKAQRSPHESKNAQQELVDLFPSRRKWPKLGQEARKHLSPIDINKRRLSLAFQIQKSKAPEHQENWYKTAINRAILLSAQIQSKKGIQIQPPSIRPTIKNEKQETYRPIASFNLDDHIKISIAATYIRNQFDSLLLPNAYAFRAKNKLTGKAPTHHDAVSDLISYRKKHSGKTLYVAECDIQKFFDIVNHNSAKTCFYKLIKEYKQTQKQLFDTRAIKIYLDYLNCYTYESVAIPEAQKVFDAHKKEKAKLDKPKESELKKLYSHPSKVKYGIPQGGAISPIIANIMLHYADKDILEAYGDNPIEDLFYARYCDDMIIVHPDKEICAQLLEAYCQSLKELRLLVHPPENFKKYNKKFYDCKSKSPYPWEAPKPDKSAVPWVSFVGYQIHYNGEIRIRKNSIIKEIEKQSEIAIKTIQSLRKYGKITDKSGYQILYRLKCKLTNMAVGKRFPNSIEAAKGMCWATGFKLLATNKHYSSQLKRLDRRREKVISKVKFEIEKHGIDLKSDEQKATIKKKKLTKYFGGPYSYFRGFMNT